MFGRRGETREEGVALSIFGKRPFSQNVSLTLSSCFSFSLPFLSRLRSIEKICVPPLLFFLFFEVVIHSFCSVLNFFKTIVDAVDIQKCLLALVSRLE